MKYHYEIERIKAHKPVDVCKLLELLEDAGWEIFSINNSDYGNGFIVVRKPR